MLEKLLSVFFYNAEQNITAESVGKSQVCFLNAMGQTALSLFGFKAVTLSVLAQL